MIFTLQIGFLDINWTDVLDILLVSGLFYHIYRLMSGTLAVRIFIGVLLLYFIYLLVKAARMELLTIILGQFSGVGVLAIIILFQQEIRRFLFLLGETTTSRHNHRLIRNLFRFFNKEGDKIMLNTPNIIAAVALMSAKRTGALIVISRDSPLEILTEMGDRLYAQISKRLLIAIFNKFGPMHDGAVIIHKNKIVAARCILPISGRITIPPHFGTRHRAAIGISEQSNVFAIAVSEETGQVAIAQNGQLSPNISLEKLRTKLYAYTTGTEETPTKKPAL